MFTKRIIPCLDVNNGRVVKGVNFVNLKDAGDPVEIEGAMIRLVRMKLSFWISQLPVMEEIQWWILCAEWQKRCLFLLLSAAVSVQ